MSRLSADDVIRLLDLKPLPAEGGFFRETYRSPATADVGGGHRHLGTCIYYLITQNDFSALHRLRFDETFHFYLGDAVEMLELREGGASGLITLGPDLAGGESVQRTVPAGVWQGTRLRTGGRWALLGTTMAPGFDFADFELGERGQLQAQYPSMKKEIERYTRSVV